MRSVFYIIVIVLIISFCNCEDVNVIGTIHCQHHKQPKPFVSLYDKDFSGVTVLEWLDSDDLLDSINVNYGAQFELYGSETEVFSIEPQLIVEHECLGYSKTEVLDLSTFVRSGDLINVGHLLITEHGFRHINNNAQPQNSGG